MDMPPAMEDALDRYNRDFEPWATDDYDWQLSRQDFTPRQTPWAVVGDFNDDGRADLAVAGRDDRDALVVLLLSAGARRYRSVEIERDPYDEYDRRSLRPPRLSYLYPGRYVIDDQRLYYPREILVDRPAVEITGGRRPGAVLYTVEGNSVVPYYLSDRPAAPVRGRRDHGGAPRLHGSAQPSRERQDGRVGDRVALSTKRGISAAKLVPSERMKKYSPSMNPSPLFRIEKLWYSWTVPGAIAGCSPTTPSPTTSVSSPASS